MKRMAYTQLLEWKSSKDRKPLIVNGARQVGKTWLLKEFGKNEYKNVVYINCDNNPLVNAIFNDYDVMRLIQAFSAISNEQIIPGETLIILDEVQEEPKAITALKYFHEYANQYHIVVAGSLLGISLHTGSGYPVGKVDELNIYPMNFSEFLWAMNNDILYKMLQDKKWNDASMLSNKLENLLRQYYFTGGMPEVVSKYVQTKNLNDVRKIQNRIVSSYQQDFAKHIPTTMLSKVQMVWNSIPAQLAKENKKFIYSMLKKGARAKEFEDAIEWLLNAGLIYKVNRVNKIEMPLKFYEEFGSFKLFLLDIGLLGAMVDVPAKDVLVESKMLTEYKGTFTEQYVCQQFLSSNKKLYYYSKDNSTLEIDFVYQDEIVHPIEVKAEKNVKAKSLKSIIGTNNSLIGWRFSMLNYEQQDKIINIPLYFVSEWIK